MKKRHALGRRRTVLAYLFLSPTILFYIIFFLVPVFFSLYISLIKWDMLSPVTEAPFVGLKNYIYILTRDDLFWVTLKNTLVFAFGTVTLSVFLSLVLAFLFTRSRLKVLWRIVYWLPMVTTVVAIGQLWVYMLDGVYGLINTLIGHVGIVGPNWLSDETWALPTVMMISVWSGLGGAMLIFSAGLEGISETFYEAARVDGATVWQEFWKITMPLLRPAILFNLVTGFIGGLSAFVLIMVMTQGGPVNATNVVGNYMYQVAFQDMRMGRASAMSFVLFAIILVVTLLQLRIFRRGGVEAY